MKDRELVAAAAVVVGGSEGVQSGAKREQMLWGKK